MRLRGKNSLPPTPKTVHLLRLPRTIGKRKGDDNKFFTCNLWVNHQFLSTTLDSHFKEPPLNVLCSSRSAQRFFVPAIIHVPDATLGMDSEQFTRSDQPQSECQIASPPSRRGAGTG